MSVIFKPVFKPVFKPLVDPTLVGSIQKTLSTALGWFDPTTIVGSIPVTEWQNRGVGLSGYDLDVVVGTDANLITLESGVGLLTGTAGDFFSTPDSVAASIVGDIDIRIRAAPVDNSPAGLDYLGGKFENGKRSYITGISTNGVLRFQGSTDGTNVDIDQSSAPALNGFADGTVNWYRYTVDVDNGAGGHNVIFYTSDDDVNDSDDVTTWTKLGTTKTGAGVVAFADTTAVVEWGSSNAGASNPIDAKIYRAQIYNGIDGTLAVDFDPTKATVNTATFTSGGAVWTANGDAFVNATRHTGIYSRGSVGLETTAGQALSGPLTVFAVFKPTLAAPGTSGFLFDAISGANRMLLQTNNANSDKYSIFQGSGIGIAQAYDSNLRVFTAQFNNDATSKFTISDVGSVTGDAGSGSWDFGAVFMDNANTNTISGLLLELVILDYAASDGQIALLQNHYGAKYA